jgi:hypothetical protein
MYPDRGCDRNRPAADSHGSAGVSSGAVDAHVPEEHQVANHQAGQPRPEALLRRIAAAAVERQDENIGELLDQLVVAGPEERFKPQRIDLGIQSGNHSSPGDNTGVAKPGLS